MENLDQPTNQPTNDHEQLKQSIRKRIEEKTNSIRNYTPKVGIFGVTGVGKSSLCNALFGQEAAKVSDVAACTREPKEIFIGHGDRGIKLVDVPGVGETIERDAEYFELYKKLMPELDLVIWVIKADDRAYAVPQKAYKEILLPHKEKCPVLFVINQVDKLQPLFDWDMTAKKPGSEKQKNVEIKEYEILKAFDVKPNFVQSISVEQKYQLVELMEKIVDVLPNEKKFAIVREAKEEVKNEKIEEKAEKSVWESIKDFADDLAIEAQFALSEVKKIAQEVLVETSMKVLTIGAKKAAEFIKSGKWKFWS